MKTFSSVLWIALLAMAAAVAGFYFARSLKTQIDSAAVATPAATRIGQPAPPLSVKALDGSTIDLEAFRGKTVILNFWASWCGPCIEEMPVLDHFAQAHKDDGFVVIGVAVEDEPSARAFLDRHPVSYRIGLGSADSPDESSAFGNRLNVLPYSVLIDPHGIVRRAEARTFDAKELEAWARWQSD